MSDIKDPYDPGTASQPLPVPSDAEAVWPRVFDNLEKNLPNGTAPSLIADLRADMVARHEAGIRKYGQPLRARNGRDPLRDLYEELLDAVAYSGQAADEHPEPVHMNCGRLVACATCKRARFLRDLHDDLLYKAACLRDLFPPGPLPGTVGSGRRKGDQP